MDNQAKKVDVPESFCCPITNAIMQDPVIDPDGHSYERKAIEEWLSKHAVSPMTRKALSVKDLRPNRALCDSIQEFLVKNKEVQVQMPKQVKVEQPVKVDNKKEEKSEDQLQIEVTADAKAGYAMVSIVPPVNASRAPLDVCCVVDVSGSMGSEATLGGHSSESTGLTILDIVKHALKTIIANLESNDRLSIVTFSTQAKVEFELLKMTDSNKKTALAAVERMDADGSTNLWDGLRAGLDVLQNRANGDSKAAVLLLTDGEPNIVPPRGHLPMLQKYKDQHEVVASINTFGFGYSLDSALLNELALEGNGLYSFIPDSSFVGTVFVNALSNLLSTVLTNVTLSLEPCNGAKLEEKAIVGGYQHKTTDWGALLHFGAIHAGQTRDVIVRMSIPVNASPFLRVTLKAKNTEIVAEGKSTVSGSSKMQAQRYRLEFVDTVRTAMELSGSNKLSQAQSSVKNFISDCQKSPVAKEKYIVDLLKDLTGQVTEAISRDDWYKRWGKHYLPSLMGAHLNQQCNNFKDPGVQHYGGKLFSTLRDKLDDSFCKLPPPKPSQNFYSAQPIVAPVSMAVYHDEEAPCFDGECTVLMADGSLKKVKDLSRGDAVQAPNGNKANIVCIVKTICQSNKTELVELQDGLLVTPWHPIRVNGHWCFPADLAPVTTRTCPAVFSFALDAEHVMVINNVECVSLAHGFEQDVVKHAFFGTKRVIEDLHSKRGWDNGLVELTSGCMIRDKTTGLVCALRQ